MTPSIHWLTDHSPITYTDPPSPPYGLLSLAQFTLSMFHHIFVSPQPNIIFKLQILFQNSNTSPLPITSDHLIFACDPPNWDNFWQFWKDSPGDLWHLRHWLQFWQLRTWMHDNLWYQTINCDTGQHSQLLRCSLTKPSNSHKGNEL